MIRDGQVGLLWLGQSGFVLRFPTARVLIDAFFSPHPDRLVQAPFPPSEATGFDLIACTHEHLDHLDVKALPTVAVASASARVIVPKPCVEMVIRAGVPPNRVIGTQPGQPLKASGLTVHAVPASHGLHPADAYNFGEDLSGGAVRYLGYIIEGGGVTLYHAGDTIPYDGQAARLRELHVDLALLPINGRDAGREASDIVGNMDTEEAAQLAADAGVRVVVPMHYDMFAANPGFPEQVVEAVRSRHRGPAVLVPTHFVEFVYSKA